MKILLGLLIVLSGFSLGTARAENWAKVVDNRTSRIFVDTGSINQNGDIITAWYRRDFSYPMVLEKNHRKYKSSKVFSSYNCTSREMAATQWITFEDKGGKGKVVSNEKMMPPAYGEIPLGDTGKPLFDFVCKRAAAHKSKS